MFEAVVVIIVLAVGVFFLQAEDGIRGLVRSRGLGDVYKRQELDVEMILDDRLVSAGHEDEMLDARFTRLIHHISVSYTHLTLPTIYSV